MLVGRLLIAALYFDLRLPETFAGFPIEETAFPVQHPTSCNPQAWATGAPLLGLRVLLGLEPDGGKLLSDPVLPKSIAQLEGTGHPRAMGSPDVLAAHDVGADLWQVWLSTRDIASGLQTQTSQELLRLLRPSSTAE